MFIRRHFQIFLPIVDSQPVSKYFIVLILKKMLKSLEVINMTNWQLSFENWLDENTALSDRSKKHYSGAIKSIGHWLEFDISSIQTIEQFHNFHRAAILNSTFIKRDSTGNKMYDTALKHFNKFIQSAVSINSFIYPEELINKQLTEGCKKTITINSHERNPLARKKCIEFYGAICSVCGFNFSEKYGNTFAGIIHVHHLKPLSEISEDYIIDPIKDLIPVCPNCHLIIHSKFDGIYTIDEVRKMLTPK